MLQLIIELNRSTIYIFWWRNLLCNQCCYCWTK